MIASTFKKGITKFFSSCFNGFTLVELLIVVSLIAILSGVFISVINPGRIKGRATDSQRLSDLKMIQGALEMYFSNNREYPCSSNCATPAWIRIRGGTLDPLSLALVPDYMSEMKVDPVNNSSETSPCASPTTFRYNYYSNGATYYITAIMSVSTSVDKACSGAGLPGYLTCATSAVCTFVRNP